MTASFAFILNGKPHVAKDCSPNTSVLEYFRSQGLTGTKCGCAEGDCGACSIVMVDNDSSGKPCYRAVNSCIMPLPMLAGRTVLSVEGVAGSEGLHPVQTAMVRHYGSQCGYCTPGFVMSMFEGFYRDGDDKQKCIAEQLGGNLCRCTGYRAIRDAALEAYEQRPSDSHADHLQHVRVALAPFAYSHEDGHFWRPTSLAQLFALRAEHSDAVLVAGATEIGVDINKKFKAYPKLISTEAVAELHGIEERDDHYWIGGAVPLTQVEERLGNLYPATLGKMLAVFASRQIRHRATLAGNLVTASPIGDMAPVLLALDASIELQSENNLRCVPLHEFFVGYRKTVMSSEEVVRGIIIPKMQQSANLRYLTNSYKVSKRRELDIAIVAAAYCVVLDANGVIQEARLAYGGVAATPIRAHKSEAWLLGKVWDEQLLSTAQAMLAQEFTPIADVRSGADYRVSLIPSLFAKFMRGDESLGQDLALEFTASTLWQGSRDDKELKHESGVGHVTGRAQYVDDVPRQQHSLTAWPVLSPHAHARINRLDVQKASQLPGIAKVLTAADIPGMNDCGAIRHDEAILAYDEVHYHGQVVALVLGESIAQCRRAAQLVEVDYTPLPALLSLKTAIEQNSYHTEPHRIVRGDVDKVFADSSLRQLTGELFIGGQEHFYLETHAASAELGDDGDVKIAASTQHPTEIQTVVSHALGVPRHKVVVESPRMGGGFGGKETQGNMWAALAAVGAVKTGRPVHLQLDRDLDMTITGHRHPFLGKFRAAFNKDGVISAVQVELVSDGGWALDLSESILDRAMFHLDNAYYFANVQFSGRVAKTNVASNTAFRGFGGPQGMVMCEEIVDRVARTLDLPPHIVRERNMYHGGPTDETNTTHFGQAIGDNRLQTLWQSAKKTSDFDARLQQIKSFNKTSEHIKRGIAITPVKFGIAFTASFLNQGGALVHVYRDGSVQVNTGGTEMGQGLYTKLLGIAMHELGLSADQIRVMKTRTDKVPNTSATAASSGADLNGAALRDACQKIKERVVPVALQLLNSANPERIEFADGQVFDSATPEKRVAFAALIEQAYMRQISLSATGFYRTPNIAYDKAKGKGRPFHYFASGAAVTEVEVDGYTGMHKIVRVDIVHDVGDSLNHNIDRGQIEGAYVQGLGWLTREELRWDKVGRLLTHSASTYQIPALSDAPMEFNVTLLPNAGQKDTIYGSKAVGEPPFMLAISAREAIKEAITALCRKTGQCIELPSPATHEAIFAAIVR